MLRQWILTVLGPDRPGLVEELAGTIRGCGGNWNASRFQQLHGQFAGLVDISLPSENEANLKQALDAYSQSTGLQVLSAPGETQQGGGKSLSLECIGQDRPGIVLAISDVLKSLGINVESMQTSIESAPMSGETLFRANFDVLVPEAADLQILEDRLSDIGEELLLDVQFDPR